MRGWLALAGALLVVSVGAAPAGAQEADEPAGEVDITYDIGDFDADREDWPVTVVYVQGELDEGEPFTVYLGDDDGELWSSTQDFVAPVTAVTVVPFVAVGDVTRTAVAQGLADELAAEVVRPPPAVLPNVLVEAPAPVPNAPMANAPVPNAPGRSGGPITEVLGQGSGGGGGGVLALSMVLSVILVAIVFRTPLPSQATQRWTK